MPFEGASPLCGKSAGTAACLLSAASREIKQRNNIIQSKNRLKQAKRFCGARGVELILLLEILKNPAGNRSIQAGRKQIRNEKLQKGYAGIGSKNPEFRIAKVKEKSARPDFVRMGICAGCKKKKKKKNARASVEHSDRDRKLPLLL